MNENDLNSIIDFFFPITSKEMMYKEETLDRYIYYAGIPGLTKDDLDIRLYTEKDFVSIVIKSKKDSAFVKDLNLRIALLVSDVSQDKTPEALVEKGVLQITFYKANPIKKTIL